MNYKIEFSNKAYKYYKKIDAATRKRINNHLLLLAENPRHSELDIKKLKGYKDTYRLRIGDLRLLYSIEDNVLIITLLKISPRGDVYNI
jgi:mRNA interferase RelE/StbE